MPLETATGRIVSLISLDTAGRHEIDALLAAVPTSDLVVMTTTAGNDASAAARIGEACSHARVMTMTLVVRGVAATDEMLSCTLAHVRPWSLMVVVAGDAGYLDDILKSFR